MDNRAVFSMWFSNWTFIQGKPAEGWQNKRQPGKYFDLDACINLDSLCEHPVVPNESEGVLYADFSIKEAGKVLFGLACDWCLEAFCDGILICSTFPDGNGSSYIFPNNHRVLFPATEGAHLLAVHVRRGKNTWNFACGGVSPEPPPEPKLTYGPWLTNPDTGTITVAFSCSAPLGAAVRYRLKGTEEWQTIWHQRQGQCLRRTYHAIRLSELEPGAEYEYQLVVIHPDSFLEIKLGDNYAFKAPDAICHNYSFFFTADLQFPADVQHEILRKLLDAAHADECDFFVLDGDINSAFLPDNVISGPFAQLCEYGASSKPIIYVRGNHELRGPYGDCFVDYFSQNNDMTYDVIRIGDTAFLLLDSWEDKPAKTPGHPYCQWNMDELFIQAETAWLKNAMNDACWTGARRRIVICHGAAYSHYDSCLTIPFVLQKMTDTYFEGEHPVHSINMWLAGHVHRYMRSIPGTDEIAAELQPPAPFKGGKTYKYPVLTVAGPNGYSDIKATCFRVDADETGFNVRSWDQKGRLLEDVRYENDGTCIEKLAFPHFDTPACLPK